MSVRLSIAAGKTRPLILKKRAACSTPSHNPPAISSSAAMIMLPTLWSFRSPGASKRYSKTSASFLRPASATRQFLTSPGGATPSSCLRRPLEPPSSATVTTAVRSATLSRNPRKSTGSPVPPPNATTRKSSYLLTTDQYTVLRRQQDLTPVASRWLTRAAACGVLSGFLAFEIPVPREEVDLGVALPEPPGELLDDDDRAVAPAGTADAQSEVRLAFGGVARNQEREQFARLLQKRRGVVMPEHGVAHRPVVARERPQIGVVVGVW